MAPKSKPPPYTSDPLRLLRSDVWLCVRLSITWPIRAGLLSIVSPLRPCGSGDLDELSFTALNAWASILHFILVITQSIFIICVPTSAILGLPFPGLLFSPALLITLVGFVVGNGWFCYLLNGPSHHIFAAGKEWAANPERPGDEWVSSNASHAGERWVFINGVAVGSHWLNSNLKRLALTFQRPILGIHNTTNGILFDVLECMIQRTFGYPTDDIRKAYEVISTILADSATTKLVLIAHSQGAIEAGMVLDWLFATLPASDVAKLEIYTFGNASNHWNCPFDENGDRIIRHIEHFANKGDWVSRFGILQFRPRALLVDASVANATQDEIIEPATPATPDVKVVKKSTFEIENQKHGKHRFVGRMFLREAYGHQMNQHYLDNMFPLDKQKKVMAVEECVWMNGHVDEVGVERDNVVELKKRGQGQIGQRVWHYCRLWGYVGGGVPQEQ